MYYIECTFYMSHVCYMYCIVGGVLRYFTTDLEFENNMQTSPGHVNEKSKTELKKDVGATLWQTSKARMLKEGISFTNL